MHMSLPRSFAVNRFEIPDGRTASIAIEPLPSWPSLIRRLQLGLCGRRRRKAPPFEHLNDHLRRDIGLEPLEAGVTRRCGG